MKNEDSLKNLFTLADLIGEMFKPNCEVAISDLSKKPGQIIYIFNGKVTGRKVGETLDKDTQARLREQKNAKHVNYKKNILLSDKEIKSSTAILTIGGTEYSFCINFDCTLDRKLQFQLESFLAMQGDPIANEVEDYNVKFIEDAVKQELVDMGLTTFDLTKESRKDLIRRLMKRNVFDKDRAVITVSNFLGLSRYTIYNDLKSL